MEFTENLILYVERFPCLWDMRLKEYHNRELKDMAWLEIFRDLHLEWDILTETDKRKRALEVKKKWANIRDTYKKDLNKVKNTPGGAQGYKRYIYAEYLGFLDPIFEDKSYEGNNDNSMDASNKIALKTEEPYVDCGTESDESEETSPEIKRRRKNSSVPDQILKILKNKYKNAKTNEVTEDDDTKFLLSLRSDLKVMNLAQKLKFKIGTLELLSKIITADDNKS